MEFLKIRNSNSQVRADGTKFAVPLFVTKNKKYGTVANEEPISVKRDIMVTGVGGKSPSFSVVCRLSPVGGALANRTSLVAALLLVSGCVGAADAPLPPDVTPYQLPTMTGEAPAIDFNLVTFVNLDMNHHYRQNHTGEC